MFDFLKSERRKYAMRAENAPVDVRPTLASFDLRSRELYEKALPRGVPIARLEPDRERENNWMSPHRLLRHRYQHGQLIVGKLGHAFLGHLDDRPIITVAGSRSGKTSTVLEPSLYLYPGSLLALDPKGSLAKAAARFRRAMGHRVFVLDPYGTSGEETACFNPLDRLDLRNETLADNIVSIVNALVVDGGDSRAQHWNDAARQLLVGIILLTLTLEPQDRNLVTVRRLLCLSHPALVGAAASESRLSKKNDQGKEEHFSNNQAAMKVLFRLMMHRRGGHFGQILAGIGARFDNTPAMERGSVFSTAATQTDFLDSIPIRRMLMRSDFQLSMLRDERPTTIFVSLPVRHMERQFRIMRMIVQMACDTLEELGPYPHDRLPIWLLAEEMAVLKAFPVIEAACSYLPEFGVVFHGVLQSIKQLQQHFPGSYDTILGNCGLVQMFVNGDDESLRYAASRMERLIAPFEMRMAFSRARGAQLLLWEGLPPAAAARLTLDDVAQIREAMRARMLGLPDSAD